MQLAAPQLVFPTNFCCNCGALECAPELQDTRVTRYFGLGGSETTFRLPLPVCAACRRTTRRRPPRILGRLLIVVLPIAAIFLTLMLTVRSQEAQPPGWIQTHELAISVTLGLLVAIVFYRLRRARPPQTSFYQPVRIRSLDVRIDDVMNGQGHVAFMKLGFTNPEYLHLFADANRDAIEAGRIAAVKA